MVEMNGHIFFPFQEKLKGLSQQENISTLNWFVDIFPEAFDLTLLNSLPFFFSMVDQNQDLQKYYYRSRIAYWLYERIRLR